MTTAPTPSPSPTSGDQVDDNPFLDDDERPRLHDLIDHPAARIEALRADLRFQRRIARADVMPRLCSWFTPDEHYGDGGWAHAAERSGPVGRASVCVAWSFRGAYIVGFDPGDAAEPPVPFNGVLPLGQAIDLHGVTFMGVEDDRFLLRRHVDWAGLHAQLGLSLNWRTPLDAADWRGARVD